MQPSLSIITICFNNPDDLVRTCRSVDMQEELPYEHLIIDGSTNASVREWLEKEPQPDYRRWICESDEGIADAFNKGILRTKGGLLLLLNSGDSLYDATVLRRVLDRFEKDPDLMWLHGKLQTLRGGVWVIVGKPFEKTKLYRGMRGTFHPTMFVKRDVYDRHGLFRKEIKMAMDYDFLCRIADERHTFLDYPLAKFDPTGVSTTKYLAAMDETYAVYRKYYGGSLRQKLWSWRLTFLHYLLQSKPGKALYRVKVKLGLERL